MNALATQAHEGKVTATLSPVPEKPLRGLLPDCPAIMDKLEYIVIATANDPRNAPRSDHRMAVAGKRLASQVIADREMR
jgi:hypothetical protein